MAPSYLELEKLPNGNLKMTLTKEGKEEWEELTERHGNDTLSMMHDLLEHALGNGWELVDAADIGALTGCDLILSEEVERDEDGEILTIGECYWHPNYMVQDPIDVLAEKGEFVLKSDTVKS